MIAGASCAPSAKVAIKHYLDTEADEGVLLTKGNILQTRPP